MNASCSCCESVFRTRQRRGYYTITNVPAGTYSCAPVNDEAAEQDQGIVVPANGDVQ